MGSTEKIGAEQVRGRATGAFFFVGFGTVWVYLGLLTMRHASPAAVFVLGTIALALLGMAMLLMRRARELPEMSISREEKVRAQRMFTAVNIIQWVSIGTAVAILNLLHMPEYISAAIAILVGLHLLPLAESLRNPQHYLTGTLLIAWPLGCLLAEPRSRVSGISALGTGAILLLSAAAMMGKYSLLLKGFRPRRVVPQA